jgi:hypothetical protein
MPPGNAKAKQRKNRHKRSVDASRPAGGIMQRCDQENSAKPYDSYALKDTQGAWI